MTSLTLGWAILGSLFLADALTSLSPIPALAAVGSLVALYWAFAVGIRAPANAWAGGDVDLLRRAAKIGVFACLSTAGAWLLFYVGSADNWQAYDVQTIGFDLTDAIARGLSLPCAAVSALLAGGWSLLLRGQGKS